jgi:hypothetical protein
MYAIIHFDNFGLHHHFRYNGHVYIYIYITNTWLVYTPNLLNHFSLCHQLKINGHVLPLISFETNLL